MINRLNKFIKLFQNTQGINLKESILAKNDINKNYIEENDFFDNEVVERITTNLIDEEPIDFDIVEKSKSKEASGLEEDALEQSILKLKDTIIQLRLKETWSDLFKWFNEYSGSLLIIVYGLGALIQILELSAINITYIRFFSIAQLISDGTLILIVTALILFSFKISSIFIDNQVAFREIEKSIKTKSELKGIEYLRYLSFLFMTLVSMYLIYVLDKEVVKSSFYLTIVFVPFALYFIIYSNKYFKEYHRYLLMVKDTKIKFSISYYLTWILNIFYVLSLSIFIIYSLVKIPWSFYQAIRMPEDIGNYSMVSRQIESDYNGVTAKNYEILYFNNKYLFVQVKELNEDEVINVIYKTNDILFKPTVYEIKITE